LILPLNYRVSSKILDIMAEIASILLVINFCYCLNGNMDLNLKEILRQHRRLSGLSQSQLAKIAGVGKTVVFDLEHGKESVHFDTLKKVLGALNIRFVLQSPVLERSAKQALKLPIEP
jgi:HTH-type transcriptional regulator / antitoxin HipB